MLEISTIGLHPVEHEPQNFYFQRPAITKMQRICQNILKEGNGDHKYLRCQNIWDNNFEVMRSEIALDKVDMACAETIKDKYNGND